MRSIRKRITCEQNESNKLTNVKEPYELTFYFYVDIFNREYFGIDQKSVYLKKML